MYGAYLNTLYRPLRKGLKNVTDIPLWINSVLESMSPDIRVAVMAHHMPIF